MGPGAGLDRGDSPGYGCLHWRGDGDDFVRVNVNTYQLHTLNMCSLLYGIYSSVTMLKKETARPESLGASWPVSERCPTAGENDKDP